MPTFSIFNAQKDASLLLGRLKEKENNISPLCLVYRSEKKKPTNRPKRSKYKSFKYLLYGFLSYSLIINVIYLDYKLFSDATGLGGAASIMGTFTLIVMEIFALLGIYNAVEQSKRLNTTVHIPFQLNVVKIIPVLIAAAATSFNIITDLLNDNIGQTYPYIMKGLMIFLPFLGSYIVLIYTGQKGILFLGLSIPFEFFQEKGNKKELQNEKLIDKLVQEIQEVVNDWIQSINHYNNIFNPILVSGEPNPNHLNYYDDESKDKFLFTPFHHSLTNNDVRSINEIYGRTIIPLGDNDLLPPINPEPTIIDNPPSEGLPMGQETQTPSEENPEDDLFNDHKKLVV